MHTQAWHASHWQQTPCQVAAMSLIINDPTESVNKFIFDSVVAVMELKKSKC